MIQKLRLNHPVKVLCQVLEMSSSSYYRWLSQKGKTPRQREDEALKCNIHKSWNGSRKTYGSPRIEGDLRKQGIRTSRKRVARLMKEDGIEGCFNRRKKPLATDSKHGGRISKNVLKDRPFPSGPREVVVTDTTYVWTDQGWHYLATVMDLWNREILGWSFSSNNDRHLVCQALWNASEELNKYPGIVHHSDRGSTYCSEEYLKLLKMLGLQSSMSARGYCYDNAHMESFFGSLKCECEALESSLRPEEVRLELFSYIEGFYNTHRIHTALNGLSPREYAQWAVGAAPQPNSPAGRLFTPPSPTNFLCPFSMERE